MPRITISYRRDDSGVITGRIFDRLVARYGRGAIFRDIDDVPYGVDFRTHIEEVLAATDVLVAVVGPNWAGPSASQSRLSNEADPVRVEIETALRKKLPLIPVLVLGAIMPTVTQLPESLTDFAYRNAVELDAGQNFDVGMARLTRAIDGILGLAVEAARASVSDAGAFHPPPQPPNRRATLIGASIACGLAVVVAGGWYVGFDHQKSPSPVETAAVAPKVAPSPTVAPPSTTPAAPIAAPAPPSVDPEMVFWQTISSSSTAADFEEYLRKFPQGQFAGLARNRIASLRPIPQSSPAPSNLSAADAFTRGKAAHDRGDYADAMIWYRKAVDLGSAAAENEIGFMYGNGEGVAQSYPEAMKWYRKAADHQDANAAYRLASQYTYGSPADYAEALRWLHKAADQGYGRASSEIGSFYARGWSVPRDLGQARKWVEKGAAAPDPDPDAKGKLDWIARGAPK